ncbi:MAG TPA: hypothetical protein VM327_01040 [Candidatus Thermoplasmatota archaeon]|nr:hypothetical protein [Candidatus Thermoplasmatota archaeon]
MGLPERVPGFVVAAGRAIGRDLPALDARDVLRPWREAIGGRGPFFVRLEAGAPAAIAHIQRLSRIGELWLDARVDSVEEALDLVIAGASRLVVPTADRDPDLLDAVGPSALIEWDGLTPWHEVQAAALEHSAPVLASATPPGDAACDVFVVDGDGHGIRLTRVASAPTPTPPQMAKDASPAVPAATGAGEDG